MKFVLKPSLQHMILVKIVVSLWNNKVVRYFIERKLRILPDFNQTSENWTKIEDRVIKTVPELSLPHLLKEKVLGFIKPIGVQILEWIKFHSKQFNLHLNLPAEFSWTPLGTIDKKKTAELLIRDDNLDTSIRYKLACIYCLEDDIHKFWKNMPEIIKASISNKYRIINFWSRNMSGRGLGHSSYVPEFHQAACWDNVIAAEYFLRKLTPSEREHCLVDTAKFVRNTDVLILLLSEMEDEQQIEVFKKNPSKVLSCFLQFPLQSYFFEIATCIAHFLSLEDYIDVFRNIVYKVIDGYKDWNYQRLFREFWEKSLNAMKNSIENDVNNSWHWLLPCLFKIKDKENIKLILKDTTPAVRQKFVNSDIMNYTCQRSIRANEWDFLEFGIRECFPSKSEMLECKEQFEKCHYLRSPYFKELFDRNKQKWDQIFICPDGSLSKYDLRRSVEEGECSSSKRFRNQP